MRRAALALILATLPLAQAQRDDAQAARNTVQLLERVKTAPRLHLAAGDLPLKVPRQGSKKNQSSGLSYKTSGSIWI
jgi:hypothetical protein